MDISDIRREIDGIDGELAELFQRRMALSGRVAEYKRAHAMRVLDDGREREVLARAEAAAHDEAMRPVLRRFFETVMAMSRRLQQEKLEAGKATVARGAQGGVAFLGPEGSFSHEAALAYFGPAEAVPAASFEDVAEAVAAGCCAFGILPVENSLTGGVFAAMDLLGAGRLRIVGETVLPVRHCLAAAGGAAIAGIRTVLSHPQPLEQCRQYIRRMGWETRACGSTAGAAAEVARAADPTLAAIASLGAARLHGLAVLEEDVQDNPENYTRFVVVSAEGGVADDADKISAVFVVEHRPGTLYGTLRAFADRGVNLLNLVSRPVPGSPWQYSFHMDLEGSLSDRNVREALTEAGRNCRSILILGNYRKWER